MDKNFVVDNAVAIDIEGSLYDLHNFYDFKELNIDAAIKVVSLLFVINSQTVKDRQMYEKVSIKFRGVQYFELSQNFVSKITCDLEEIGYKNPGDMDVDWLIDENKSVESDHIFFRFANDEFIRIYSKEAYCSVD